jgi:hypothetical protein
MGRPRRRWEDNIRMNLQEVGCGRMDWIGFVQDRERWRTVVNAVMNLLKTIALYDILLKSEENQEERQPGQ